VEVLLKTDPKPAITQPSEWYTASLNYLADTEKLINAAQSLDKLTASVRKAARTLTDADGATFVLRDGDQCYYLDEDAITPLWKGQRFPMCACISGWVMVHGKPAVIEDIYKDPRVPIDAYKVTFVKSLAMVPIGKGKPIGAIGNYWATQRKPGDEEVTVLQVLADMTAAALQDHLYVELQQKVAV